MAAATQDDLELVRRYMDHRVRNDTRGVLELVSDDISLEGTFASAKGKEQFGNYLDQNRAKGKWGEPYVKEGADHVGVEGAVKIAFINVRMMIRFYFKPVGENEEGKRMICRIVVARGGGN